jgi:hypothetical protein
MRIFVSSTTINLISLKLRFALSLLPGNCQHKCMVSSSFPEKRKILLSYPRVDILRRNLTKTLVLLLPPVDISSVLTMGELIYVTNTIYFHNIKKY